MFLLFLLLAAAPLAAQPAVSEIEKFGWVSNDVATGGQPTVPQIASLAHEGFRTIVKEFARDYIRRHAARNA